MTILERKNPFTGQKILVFSKDTDIDSPEIRKYIKQYFFPDKNIVIRETSYHFLARHGWKNEI